MRNLKEIISAVHLREREISLRLGVNPGWVSDVILGRHGIARWRLGALKALLDEHLSEPIAEAELLVLSRRAMRNYRRRQRARDLRRGGSQSAVPS